MWKVIRKRVRLQSLIKNLALTKEAKEICLKEQKVTVVTNFVFVSDAYYDCLIKVEHYSYPSTVGSFLSLAFKEVITVCKHSHCKVAVVLGSILIYLESELKGVPIRRFIPFCSPDFSSTVAI